MMLVPVLLSLRRTIRPCAREAAAAVEGYVLFVTGIHEEAQEEDVLDAFADFGDVRNITVNLDRRTGFAKGYALVEFEKFEEAEEAIKEMNGGPLLGKPVAVDWAFVKEPRGGRGGGGRVSRRGGRRGRR